MMANVPHQQFVTAGSIQAHGIGTMGGNVARHNQLAMADDRDQEHPINAGEHLLFLTTPFPWLVLCGTNGARRYPHAPTDILKPHSRWRVSDDL
jgi:hypothetical protein